MHFSYLILFLSLAFSPSTTAQSPNAFAGYPACAQECLLDLFLTSMCATNTNPTCFCTDADYISKSTVCVSSKCDQASQEATFTIGLDKCKEAGVNIFTYTSAAAAAATTVTSKDAATSTATATKTTTTASASDKTTFTTAADATSALSSQVSSTASPVSQGISWHAAEKAMGVSAALCLLLSLALHII